MASQTFGYTGAAEAWTVPAGVDSIIVECWGAQGGAANSGAGGPGGYAKSPVPVEPGEILWIRVGGKGGDGGSHPTGGAGGFNGGGKGGASTSVGSIYTNSGGGGGGASDVRRTSDALTDRLCIGGGGGGACLGKNGGAGGGYQGGAGSGGIWTGAPPFPGANAQGGTQTAGGSGGSSGGGNGGLGGSGQIAVGGYGADSATVNNTAGARGGGGGGGGLYGGGGGHSNNAMATSTAVGSGAGGSGFKLSGGDLTTSTRTGNGLVRITWSDVPRIPVLSSRVINGDFSVGSDAHETTVFHHPAGPLWTYADGHRVVGAIREETRSLHLLCSVDEGVTWTFKGSYPAPTDIVPGDTGGVYSGSVFMTSDGHLAAAYHSYHDQNGNRNYRVGDHFVTLITLTADGRDVKTVHGWINLGDTHTNGTGFRQGFSSAPELVAWPSRTHAGYTQIVMMNTAYNTLSSGAYTDTYLWYINIRERDGQAIIYWDKWQESNTVNSTRVSLDFNHVGNGKNVPSDVTPRFYFTMERQSIGGVLTGSGYIGSNGDAILTGPYALTAHNVFRTLHSVWTGSRFFVILPFLRNETTTEQYGYIFERNSSNSAAVATVYSYYDAGAEDERYYGDSTFANGIRSFSHYKPDGFQFAAWRNRIGAGPGSVPLGQDEGFYWTKFNAGSTPQWWGPKDNSALLFSSDDARAAGYYYYFYGSGVGLSDHYEFTVYYIKTSNLSNQLGDYGYIEYRSTHIPDKNFPPDTTNTSPASGTRAWLANGYTFDWSYLDPNGDAQTKWAFRRLNVLGGEIRYWDNTNNTWSLTEVWNTSSATFKTFPKGAWPDTEHTFEWSVRSEDATGLQGDYSDAWQVITAPRHVGDSAIAGTSSFTGSGMVKITAPNKTFSGVATVTGTGERGDAGTSTPNLVSPQHDYAIDWSVDITFDWTFEDPNVGQTQTEYGFRRRRLGNLDYEYWDPSTSSWSLGLVAVPWVVSSTTQHTFTPAQWDTSNLVTGSAVAFVWSVRTKDPDGNVSGWSAEWITHRRKTVVGELSPSGIATMSSSASTVAFAGSLSLPGVADATGAGRRTIVVLTGAENLVGSSTFDITSVKLTSFLGPNSISGQVAVGSPSLTVGPVSVTTTSVAPQVAVGSPTVAPGVVVVSPSGFDDLDAVGTPSVLRGAVTLSPTGIASTVAFGSSTITTGPVTVSPSGFDSGWALGTPEVLRGVLARQVYNAPEGEVVGAAAIRIPVRIDATLITETETAGAVAVVVSGWVLDITTLTETETAATAGLVIGGIEHGIDMVLETETVVLTDADWNQSLEISTVPENELLDFDVVPVPGPTGITTSSFGPTTVFGTATVRPGVRAKTPGAAGEFEGVSEVRISHPQRIVPALLTEPEQATTVPIITTVTRAIGQVSETETAQTAPVLRGVLVRTVGSFYEYETVTGIVIHYGQSKLVDPVTEHSSLTPAVTKTTITVASAVATETETVPILGRGITPVRPVESETSLFIAVPQSVPVPGPIEETESVDTVIVHPHFTVTMTPLTETETGATVAIVVEAVDQPVAGVDESESVLPAPFRMHQQLDLTVIVEEERVYVTGRIRNIELTADTVEFRWQFGAPSLDASSGVGDTVREVTVGEVVLGLEVEEPLLAWSTEELLEPAWSVAEPDYRWVIEEPRR